MANLLRAQEVEGGIIFDDGAGVFQDTFDPTVGGGFGAALASLFLRSDTGQVYRKTGAGDTDWTEVTAGTGGDRIVTFVIQDPTDADIGRFQHKFATAVTIKRVSASTDQGTVTLQFDERAEATPNTGGTDVLTAPLVADSNTEATTSFANAGIALDAVFNLDIDSVSGSPTIVRIHVDFAEV